MRHDLEAPQLCKYRCNRLSRMRLSWPHSPIPHVPASPLWHAARHRAGLTLKSLPTWLHEDQSTGKDWDTPAWGAAMTIRLSCVPVRSCRTQSLHSQAHTHPRGAAVTCESSDLPQPPVPVLSLLTTQCSCLPMLPVLLPELLPAAPHAEVTVTLKEAPPGICS